MTRAHVLAAALCAASCLSSCAGDKMPPPPVPGGRIDTLVLGSYMCEMPGDAGGPMARALPEYAFEVVNASSYKAGGIRGSYLYTGDHVVMTGGKLKGLMFVRVSTGFLRQVDEGGSETGMRCVLTSRAVTWTVHSLRSADKSAP